MFVITLHFREDSAYSEHVDKSIVGLSICTHSNLTLYSLLLLFRQLTWLS